jgi:two-component system OmpR family sensor kinase/two-component system sensor histidine kinase BaeS
MAKPFCGPGRPPWWPENEAWPPRDRWPRGRGRFFRRAAPVAVVLLLFSVFGMAVAAWVAAGKLGLAASQAAAAPPLWFIGGLVGIAVTLIALTARHVVTIGGVMQGVERVAGGDYAHRVIERGPPGIRSLARAFNTMTARLQNNDRLRRDLMADIAHELRTPLTVMQGTLEGLLDGVYPRDDARMQQLLEETHVLSRLVEDLRTLALSESGALKLQKEPVDVAELARDTVAAFERDAASHAVALALDAPAALDPIEIDPVRVREVLANLLSNALRHTPRSGSVHVRVSASGHGAIAVEVRDTGTGMTPEETARVFDRFYKGSDSRGTGLGLTIARSLVVAHGGEIHASSEKGRGTTITLTLPKSEV